MKKLLHLLARLRVTERDRLLLLAMAVAYLARARVEHLVLPARRLLARREHPASLMRPTAAPGLCVSALAAAIECAARHVPWRSDCLIQARAGMLWLSRHGLSPEVRIGVARDEAGALKAHAWLELDGRLVLGGAGDAHLGYIPIEPRRDGPPSSGAADVSQGWPAASGHRHTDAGQRR